MAAAQRTEDLDELALCRRFLPVTLAFFVRHRARDAEDLAHDALVALLEALRAGRIREKDRLGSYLLGVCKNLLSRRGRGDARRERALERLGEPGAIEPLEALVDPRKLWLCFNQLSARSRDVLVRTLVDDEEAATIGAALSIGEGNVRVIRHRALAALLACVEAPGP